MNRQLFVKAFSRFIERGHPARDDPQARIDENRLPEYVQNNKHYLL